jgi:crotonobetainyl-CoA:carnitine CoA-transferase CaiB-like acyl-CoA transferase
MGSSPALRGFRVVELATGIPGAYCTKHLADAGADVIKVEPPTGDPLRRWSASGAEIPNGDDGALFSFLACSKRSVVVDPETSIDPVLALLAEADAIVWTPGCSLAEHPQLHPFELHQRFPHLIVTAITAFGLEGPWSDRPATEFTLQAWSGGTIGLGRGRPDRPPVSVGGRVGEWVAGAYATIGTLVARIQTLRSSTGGLVDVSMLEALAMTLTYYPVTFRDQLGRDMRPGRNVPTPGVVAARDGLVGLGTGTGQQWLDFCLMVEHPEWAEDSSLFSDRSHLAPVIAAWAAERTVEEICSLATSLRIPNAPIGHGANLPQFEHLRRRGAFIENPRHGFEQPRPPYRTSPDVLDAVRPAPRLGEHSPAAWHDRTAPIPASRPEQDSAGELPLTGLRVLDFTGYWAGPSCTRLLAMLGADVIHLEGPGRPDGVRFVSGLPPSEPDWWERSPIFAALNTDKRSLSIDLTTNRGRELLYRFLPTCDVVVENYTPRVMEQLGLDLPTIRRHRPDAIVVRMPGFGLDGPWRDISAFAFIIEDASGLTWMTGYPDELPVEPYTIGDPNAGLHALIGLLVALEHRRRTGEGVLVEAAMIEAAINITAEQVIEHSAYGALLSRNGNRGPTAAPQNLYPTGDDEPDRWVAIAVADDAQWRALCGVLGDPPWSQDPELATAAGRHRHHDRIDEHLADWTSAHTTDEIVNALWSAGVPVGAVTPPHRQPDLPPMQQRSFFEELDHPRAGRARYSTMPIRFTNGPRRHHRTPAPALGQHNRELLREIGLSDDEITRLEQEGIIGCALRNAP